MQEMYQQLTDRSERLWLKLDLGGIEFHLRIYQYKKPPHDWYHEDWCKVDLVLLAGDWLNYCRFSREPFTSSEIEELRDLLSDLLFYRLREDKEFTTIEPDYEFYLYPWYIDQNQSLSSSNRANTDKHDVNMEMYVNIWDKDDALTCNKLVLDFSREDLEKFLCYLNFVTGQINEEDKFFRQLMEEGCISE